MKSDMQIRHEGFQALFANLDVVEAEKFLTLISRDRFDYTNWRINLMENLTVKDIIKQGQEFAVDFRKINKGL